MTIFGSVVDTRPLFPRERQALLDLLASLTAAEWTAPTVCPGWDVHDVVGHLVNDYVRRLSGSRDAHAGAVFADDETLPTYLERVNDEFVRAARQGSPRVLTDLLAHLGPQLDAMWATKVLDAPADLDVSWAATDRASPAWLDIAREYTEFWVHQQQIRDAVGRPGGADAELLGPELLGPVIDTFLRALPFALRAQARPEGTTVRFDVTGPAGGSWFAVVGSGRWGLASVAPGGAVAAHVRMDQDTLWRLATRGISVEHARGRAELRGDAALTLAATTLLTVIRSG